MTSQGSPYTRFHRARKTGNLKIVRTAALELPRVSLQDAASIAALIAQQDRDTYDRAATRWLGRFCLEAKDLTLDDLHDALEALFLLPHSADAAARLRALCQAHGLPA